MTKPLYNIRITDQSEISLSDGNTKLGKGIWTFNLLPGDQPISTKEKLLTDIPGTCHGCCEGCQGDCYAIKDTRRHHNSVIPAVVKNTLMLRKSLDNTMLLLEKRLIKEKAKVCRMHASGEFESYEHLLAAYNLAKKNPQIQFYFYTKRFEWMERLLKEKKELPANFVCNISEWHGNTKDYKLAGLNRFVYDDHTDPEVMALKHCPAVNAKGKSTGIHCNQCGLCWKKNDGHRIAVHSH